jgi:AraC family transcriptional regulator of adaptative response/methylated-DNA-[protein]-cysteine methyltransferase
VLVAATPNGICAIDFGDDPETLVRDLRARFPRAQIRENDGDFATEVAQVVAFIEAPGTGLDLPLDVQGTAFQRRVWSALREIAPGTTASYGDIARRIGSPNASRAVAQACGSNRLAVAIPCHRVVESNGNLGGYRWGIERKRALLEREASAKSGQ